MELSAHPRDVDQRHSEYLGWKNYHEHVVNTFHASRRSLAFCFSDGTLVGCTGVHDSPHDRVGGVWALGSKNSLDILNFKGGLKKSYGNLKSILGAYEFMKISREHFDWLFGEDFELEELTIYIVDRIQSALWGLTYTPYMHHCHRPKI